MEGLRASSSLTRRLAAAGMFSTDPFVLIDVGCSGGIEGVWRDFGPNLVAHAFDPVISECERLQQAETYPGVRYHGRFVGLRPDHPFARLRREEEARYPNPNPWDRLSCAPFYRPKPSSAASPPSPPAPPRRIANPEDIVGVTEFARQQGLSSVDFVKIDVDGTDIEVLMSAAELLAEGQVLGVGLEVNWYGGAHSTSNTFHNMDRLMREHGFSLFTITQRPYSRVALPAPFQLVIAAQTSFGQPYQGDAGYLRDLAAPANRSLADTYRPTKLLKLACLYDALGLPDCAAEVLLTFRDRFGMVPDFDGLLDSLVPPLHGRTYPYREYMRYFEEQPDVFFPNQGGSRS